MSQLKFIKLEAAACLAISNANKNNPEISDSTLVKSTLTAQNIYSYLTQVGVEGFPKYDSQTELPIIFIEPINQILVDSKFYGVDNADLNSLTSDVLTILNYIGTPSQEANAAGTIYQRIQQLVADVAEAKTEIVTGAQGNGIEVTSTTDSTDGHLIYTIGVDNTIATKNEVTAARDAAKTVVQQSTGIIVTPASGEQGNTIYTVGIQGSLIPQKSEVILVGNQGWTNADNIANEINTKIAGIQGTNGDWANGEDQTLAQLRTLIAGLRSDVSTLSGADQNTLNTLTAIIDEIKQVEDGEQGDFANTLLDKLLTLRGDTLNSDGTTPSGAQTGGYYAISVNNGDPTYVNSIPGIISALESYINAKFNIVAQQSGVVSVYGIQGIVNVGDNNVTTGEVTLKATSDALLTATIGNANNDYYGLKGEQGVTNTVQQALTGLNNGIIIAGQQADLGVTNAATAQTAAETAQTTANTAEAHGQQALTQLTWVVV